MYFVDMNTAPNVVPVFVPCTFKPSIANAGKTLVCREGDGACMVVEPDGSQTRWCIPGADPGYDTAYTWADAIAGYVVFRSGAGANAPHDHPEQILGVPHAYRMVA